MDFFCPQTVMSKLNNCCVWETREIRSFRKILKTARRAPTIVPHLKQPRSHFVPILMFDVNVIWSSWPVAAWHRALNVCSSIGVCVIWPPVIWEWVGPDNRNTCPWYAIQFNNPPTSSSGRAVRFNQHLSKTVLKQREHYTTFVHSIVAPLRA